MIWLFVAIFVLVDVAIVGGVLFGSVYFILRPLAERFPAVEPLPEALTRRFQSFRIDMLNLGFSMHVAVDADHLHLTPVAPFRWLGAKTISIPWAAIEITGRPKLGGVSARIGRTMLVGPAWCMNLALPDQDGSA